MEETIASDQGVAYTPIEDYGLIGNCHTAALVSNRGSLDWLCMPCFDSPSVFAGILDAERGGSWSVRPTASCRSEHRYLEHANVLETIFVCEGGSVRLLDFMPIFPEAAGGTVRPPNAVIRFIEGLDGEIEIESFCQPRPDYGRSFPTFDVRDAEAASAAGTGVARRSNEEKSRDSSQTGTTPFADEHGASSRLRMWVATLTGPVFIYSGETAN